MFKKPKNMKYTDLCIWIDKHAYDEDCDEEKLFQYIYMLVSMFSHKNHYFTKKDYYDEFCLISTERLFLRLRNPKQFEYKADGTPKLCKIDSILNYIKLTLYPLKVDFEQETYHQLNILDNPEVTDQTLYSCHELSNLYIGYNFAEIDIDDYLHRLSAVIKDFLSDIPYLKNSSDWYNIYTSCLLSFLNSITLSRHNLERLSKKDKYKTTTVEYLNKLYQEETRDFVILYHLDASMKSYINVLTNRIKMLVIKDLTELHYINDSLTNTCDDMLTTMALSEIYSMNI